MSNTLPTSSIRSEREYKELYLDLVAKGYSEAKALSVIDLPKSIYIRMIMDDIDFAKDIEDARKLRAEVWIQAIADSVSDTIEKDEVPSERLRFDKLMYLAKADNPDRYGGNSKRSDININLGQFKLMAPEDAIKSLTLDPFAIETTAEILSTPDEELL